MVFTLPVSVCFLIPTPDFDGAGMIAGTFAFQSRPRRRPGSCFASIGRLAGRELDGRRHDQARPGPGSNND
jgi:hypothetical protein